MTQWQHWTSVKNGAATYLQIQLRVLSCCRPPIASCARPASTWRSAGRDVTGARCRSGYRSRLRIHSSPRQGRRCTYATCVHWMVPFTQHFAIVHKTRNDFITTLHPSAGPFIIMMLCNASGGDSACLRTRFIESVVIDIVFYTSCTKYN